jgi:hypothetical protein
MLLLRIVYCVAPMMLVASVFLLIISPDTLTMVGNAVAVIFILEVDNVVESLLLTSSRATDMLDSKVGTDFIQIILESFNRRNLLFRP